MNVTDKSDERRTSPRIACDAAVSLIIPHGSISSDQGSFLLIKGRVCDSSRHGLRIECTTRIDPKTIWLQPHLPKFGEKFVKGSVVDSREFSNGHWEHGIELDDDFGSEGDSDTPPSDGPG